MLTKSKHMLAKTKHFVRLISLFTTQNSSKRPNNPQFSHQNRRFYRQFEKLFIPLILLLISRKSNGVLLRKTNWEKREKKRNSGVLKNRFKSTYIPTCNISDEFFLSSRIYTKTSKRVYTFTEQEALYINSVLLQYALIQSICGQKPDCSRSGRFQK